MLNLLSEILSFNLQIVVFFVVRDLFITVPAINFCELSEKY